MKFIHLADLHLGKRLNGFSLMEDQRFILDQILRITEETQPDVVMIAGDVYDRSVSSEEAVRLLDDFLYGLSELGVRTMMISGNHDSAERIAFGGRLMRRSGVSISSVYDGRIQCEEVDDEWGPVKIWLIPFLRPSGVRAALPDEEIGDYTDAMRAVIGHMDMNPAARNIAVAHQFVVAGALSPETCDSEILSVGGLDSVDASVFEGFDYVALGHLHGPQGIGRETVRYAGSPLKYSFSEIAQKKGVTVGEMDGEGNVTIRMRALKPFRELRERKGTFAELTAAVLPDDERQDYYRVILTDEQDVPEAMARLRIYYPNLMLLDYDNRRTRSTAAVELTEDAEERTPMELFELLYEQQNGQPMDSSQHEIADRLIREIWEEEI